MISLAAYPSRIGAKDFLGVEVKTCFSFVFLRAPLWLMGFK
jgi:hypothetical protein